MLNAVLISLVIASVVLWIQSFAKFGLKLDGLVPQRRRWLPFWNAGDPLVMFGQMILFTVAFQTCFVLAGIIPIPSPGAGSSQAVSTEDEQIRSQLATIWTSVLAGASAMATTIVWLQVRFRRQHGPSSSATTSFDSRPELRPPQRSFAVSLGLPFDFADVGLGLKASIMILPPVLLISAGVSQIVPYEHPVLDVLKDLNAPLRLAGIFWCTAIVTPLVEEFLFRGLLIGGLERMFFSFHSPETVAGDRQVAPKSGQPSNDSLQHASPIQQSSSSQPPSQAGRWTPSSPWPILISSFLFAMAHFGQGAAPVPLFVLAVALGYLYQRTGRLTAPIIVHMVLNALTLCVEMFGHQA